LKRVVRRRDSEGRAPRAEIILRTVERRLYFGCCFHGDGIYARSGTVTIAIGAV
jgi:hypothetical protein